VVAENAPLKILISFSAFHLHACALQARNVFGYAGNVSGGLKIFQTILREELKIIIGINGMGELREVGLRDSWTPTKMPFSGCP
jgi:hypothetical protein